MSVRWQTSRPVRLSRRGERTILAAAALLALLAGATAHLWDPYTRHADRCTLTAFEDGSAVTRCGESVRVIHSADR